MWFTPTSFRGLWFYRGKQLREGSVSWSHTPASTGTILLFIYSIFRTRVLHKISFRNKGISFYCQILLVKRITIHFYTWNSQKYYRPSLSKHSKIPFFSNQVEKVLLLCTKSVTKNYWVSYHILIDYMMLQLL